MQNIGSSARIIAGLRLIAAACQLNACVGTALFLTPPRVQGLQRSQPDAEQIRGAFGGYKKSILQQDGRSAVSFINRATLDYYARMKTLALAGAVSEVRQLSPMNKLMILSLRHRVPANDLRTMTPEQVFTYAVNEGWIGKSSVLDSDIGQTEIFGNDASAEYLKSGKTTPLTYRFTKEGGAWKIDLTPLIARCRSGNNCSHQKQWCGRGCVHHRTDRVGIGQESGVLNLATLR
jgi:hypothetical protein